MLCRGEYNKEEGREMVDNSNNICFEVVVCTRQQPETEPCNLKSSSMFALSIQSVQGMTRYVVKLIYNYSILNN